jgi:hypothetical protein
MRKSSEYRIRRRKQTERPFKSTLVPITSGSGFTSLKKKQTTAILNCNRAKSYAGVRGATTTRANLENLMRSLQARYLHNRSSLRIYEPTSFCECTWFLYLLCPWQHACGFRGLWRKTGRPDRTPFKK